MPPDIFIGYNRKDEDAAVRLYRTLKDHGLVPWIDVLDATPGRPWQDEAGDVLATAPAAAFLVGASGPGPWEALEIQVGLTQFVKRRSLAIPVLLEDVPEKPDLPPFLAQMNWVDLRRDGDLDRLVRAVEKVRPAPPEASLPEHHPWVQLCRENLDILLHALADVREET